MALKKHTKLFLLVLFLLPLFFIQKTVLADWGDDYIQYIYQSQHVFNASDHKVVVNSNDHAPTKRGALFSLLLAANTSGTIINYKNIVCFTYVLAALILFLFFKKHFTEWQSFFMTLCIAYNYRCLGLKNEIVAEFFFMFFLYLIFYLRGLKKIRPFFITAFLFACLVHVRVVGLVFYFAFIISYLIDSELTYTLKEKLKQLLLHAAIMLVAIFIIQTILLPLHKNTEIGFYNYSVKAYFQPSVFLGNFSVYFKNSVYFFEQEVPYFINLCLKISAVVFILIGIIANLNKRPGFIGLSLLFYAITLIIWPDQTTPTRYLLPIVPLLFYYLLKGLLFLLDWRFTSSNYKHHIVNFILAVFLLSNAKTLLLAKENSTAIGPFDPRLKNDFQKIEEVTQPTDVVAFTKPLVINLMCNRNSFALKPKTNEEALTTQNYFLVPKNNSLNEVYYLNKKLKGPTGDTLELDYFYLIKNKPLH